MWRETKERWEKESEGDRTLITSPSPHLLFFLANEKAQLLHTAAIHHTCSSVGQNRGSPVWRSTPEPLGCGSKRPSPALELLVAVAHFAPREEHLTENSLKTTEAMVTGKEKEKFGDHPKRGCYVTIYSGRVVYR